MVISSRGALRRVPSFPDMRIIARASWAVFQDSRPRTSQETPWLLKDHPPRCFSTRSAPISVPKRSGRPSNWICSRRSAQGARRRPSSPVRARPRRGASASWQTISRSSASLHKHGDRYELTADAKVFLDRKSPAYLGGAVSFMLAPEMKESFHQLTAAVRRGGTAISDEGTVSHDNPIWVEFARAMAPMMQMPARVAGGPGRRRYRATAARARCRCGARVVWHHDRGSLSPGPRHRTRLAQCAGGRKENARRAGVAERHALRPGSAFDVDWGGPYDIVLLTNFLHHFDLPTCEQLAAKAYAALAPGGRALTLEFIPEPDRITPPSTANFALVMLATTAHGDAYTFAELDATFARAGFVRSEFHALPPTTQQAVVSYRA